MAIGWITALKVIPWGDVIEAAPVLAKGARKLFTRTEQSAQETVATENAAPPAGADVLARLQHLEHQLVEMAQQQQASAALMESLASQNAQVVQAIDILRVRTRVLIVVVGVLLATWAGTVLWFTR